MKQIILLLLLLIFALTDLIGQINPLEQSKADNEFEARFDIRANSGISIPIGKYKAFAKESGGNSAAGFGAYSEILTTITPLPSSPWRISLTLGYMHHPFEAQKSKELYNLPILEGSSWNSFYTMFGVGYLSKTRLSYGMNFSVGALGYSGGNIKSGQIIKDTMEVRTWTYNLHASLAIKADVILGFQFTDQFSLFTIISIYYAAGVRRGTLLEEDFLTDAQNVVLYPNVNQESSSVQNQTTVASFNIGLGFRYKLFKEPSDFNYKFNLEENK